MGSPLPATDHNRKGGASLPEILTMVFDHSNTREGLTWKRLRFPNSKPPAWRCWRMSAKPGRPFWRRVSVSR